MNDPISDVNQLYKRDVPYITLILIVQILGYPGADFILERINLGVSQLEGDYRALMLTFQESLSRAQDPNIQAAKDGEEIVWQRREQSVGAKTSKKWEYYTVSQGK